jgi:hypothetical protein
MKNNCILPCIIHNTYYTINKRGEKIKGNIMNGYDRVNDVRLRELFESVVLDEVDGTKLYSLQVRMEIKHAYWERGLK